MVCNLTPECKALTVEINLFGVTGLIGKLKLEYGINSQKEILLIDFKKISLCFINGIPNRVFALKRCLTAFYPLTVINQETLGIVLISFVQVIGFSVGINSAQRISLLGNFNCNFPADGFAGEYVQVRIRLHLDTDTVEKMLKL